MEAKHGRQYNMIISIVSIAFRCGKSLARTCESVYSQILPEGVELEHIIVDSGGNDDILLDAAMKGSRIVQTPPKGCYNAMNIGLKQCTGDIVGLLHGGDVYANEHILADIIKTFEDTKCDFVYGDIQYINTEKGNKPGRIYSGASFVPSFLEEGFAPPHPSLYMTMDTYKLIGDYKEDYLTGADFDYFLRIYAPEHKLKYAYIPEIMVYMERGGISGKWINRLVVNNREKRRALSENGFKVSMMRLLGRYFKHYSFIKNRQS